MLNKLSKYRDNDGSLFPLSLEDMPFEVKRIFFITGVPPHTIRGKHAHRVTQQVFICVQGKIQVALGESPNIDYYILNPGESVYIPEMTWGEQEYLEEDSVALVLCSTEYNPNDYIYDKEQLIREKSNEN